MAGSKGQEAAGHDAEHLELGFTRAEDQILALPFVDSMAQASAPTSGSQHVCSPSHQLRGPPTVAGTALLPKEAGYKQEKYQMVISGTQTIKMGSVRDSGRLQL